MTYLKYCSLSPGPTVALPKPAGPADLLTATRRMVDDKLTSPAPWDQVPTAQTMILQVPGIVCLDRKPMEHR